MATAAKKSSKKGRGATVTVGGYSRLTASRHAVILKHLTKAMENSKDFREIVKAGPPPRSTSYHKLFDDDIEAILEAKAKGWTAVEITVLFQQLGRSISYSLVRSVLKGKVKKGRGLRSDHATR